MLFKVWGFCSYFPVGFVLFFKFKEQFKKHKKYYMNCTHQLTFLKSIFCCIRSIQICSTKTTFICTPTEIKTSPISQTKTFGKNTETLVLNSTVIWFANLWTRANQSRLKANTSRYSSTKVLCSIFLQP